MGNWFTHLEMVYNSVMQSKPRFYYGYVIVAASAIIMIVAFGGFYSYSVFFDSLLNEFHWSHAVTSGAFSLSNLITGLMGIVFGRVSDRLGPRKICFISGICLGSGYLLMSQVSSSWQIYAIYGLLLAIGIGGLWPALLSTVARWFTTKRGTMVGIITSGIGIGSMIFPPILSNLILNYNWRNTYFIVGLVTLVLIISMAMLIKPRPDRNELNNAYRAVQTKSSNTNTEGYTISQATATSQFWMVIAIFFLFGFSQFAIMVHIVPFANGEGIDPVAAASILGVIGGGSILSRMLTGLAADKIQVRRLLFFISIMLLFSFIWLELANSLWSIYVFGLIFGLSYGASSTIASLLAADLYGLNSLGIFIGVFACSVSFGGALGPIATGYFFDISTSYHWAFLSCVLAALITVILALILSNTRRVSSQNQVRST